MHPLQPNRPSTSAHAHTACARRRPHTNETLRLNGRRDASQVAARATGASATSPSNPDIPPLAIPYDTSLAQDAPIEITRRKNAQYPNKTTLEISPSANFTCKRKPGQTRYRFSPRDRAWTPACKLSLKTGG